MPLQKWRSGRGGGGSWGGFGWFALTGECAEGDLGGVEELSALIAGDGADEDAVGGAGDEVADALKAGEDGHGVAVGVARLPVCKDFVQASAVALVHVGLEGALPGYAAAAEGGFGAGGGGVRCESGAGREDGGGRDIRDGGHDRQLDCGFFGHSRILPMDSVRVARSI